MRKHVPHSSLGVLKPDDAKSTHASVTVGAGGAAGTSLELSKRAQYVPLGFAYDQRCRQ